MDVERREFLVSYILAHEAHLDRFMRPIFNPIGKRVLVFGCGWGTETYWALKNGAKSVFGFDPAPRSLEPIEFALAQLNSETLARYEHRQCNIWDLPDDAGPFDAIISNNVFEHVFDLAHNLAACRKFLSRQGARIHIFTDPLFLSSAGAHLPVEPWEHLTESQANLKERPENQVNWNAYRQTLNGMTITSFLEAVREAGLWIENFGVVPDRNRAKFIGISEAIPPSLKPMDLLLEGLYCTLAFPENI